jgi:hypothetical protein
MGTGMTPVPRVRSIGGGDECRRNGPELPLPRQANRCVLSPGQHTMQTDAAQARSSGMAT